MAKKPNIIGIIHSIIRPWVCWLGSALSGVTIFCDIHIVTPTRMGMMSRVSCLARSSHRKLLSRGTWENTVDHGV